MADVSMHSNQDVILDADGFVVMGDVEEGCCCEGDQECPKCSDPITDPDDDMFELQLGVDWNQAPANQDCQDCGGLGITTGLTVLCPQVASPCCWIRFVTPSGDCASNGVPELPDGTPNCVEFGPNQCCIAGLTFRVCVLEEADNDPDILITIPDGMVVWKGKLSILLNCPLTGSGLVEVIWRSAVLPKPQPCATISNIPLSVLIQDDGVFCSYASVVPTISSNGYNCAKALP